MTTIVEASMDDVRVSGCCTFSGRAVHAKVREKVWRHEYQEYYEILEDVVVYDFLN